MKLRTRAIAVLGFVFSFAALSLALGFYRLVPWTDAGPVPGILPFLPTPEMCLLIAIGLLVCGVRKKPAAAGQETATIPAAAHPPADFRRAVRFGRTLGVFFISLILGILCVWNAGEWFYRFFYRGNFDPFSDILLVPGLFDMVLQLKFFVTQAGQIVSFSIVLIVCAGLGAILYLAFKRVCAGLSSVVYFMTAALPRMFTSGSAPGRQPVDREPAPRPSEPASATPIRVVAIVIAILGIGQYLFVPSHSPLVRIVYAIDSHSGTTRSQPAETGTNLPVAGAETFVSPSPSASTGYRFPGIKDGDVQLFVVESYGHTVFTNDAHRKLMKPVYEWMTAKLAALGWFAQSGFLRSPTYGGRSWLADATILTGVRIKDQQKYDEMAQTGGPNLTQFFGQAGYSRLLAAPGTTSAEPFWKKTYEFDRYMFDPDFGYKGPYISFGRLSDQYLLEHVGLAMETMPKPRFVMTIMTSSHVPYERVPVYFDDWSRLGDGSVYYQKDTIRRFNNDWLQGGEYPEGYVTSIEYVFKSIEGYLERYPDKDSLIVILGDHQPRIPISEESATFSVPVHILYRDPATLASLEPFGFDPGFVPAGRPLPHHGMEELASMIKTVLFNDPRENQKTVIHDPAAE